MQENDRELVERAATAQGVENARLAAVARMALASLDRVQRLEEQLGAAHERIAQLEDALSAPAAPAGRRPPDGRAEPPLTGSTGA